jgi:hypothetical protein
MAILLVSGWAPPSVDLPAVRRAHHREDQPVARGRVGGQVGGEK